MIAGEATKVRAKVIPMPRKLPNALPWPKQKQNRRQIVLQLKRRYYLVIMRFEATARLAHNVSTLIRNGKSRKRNRDKTPTRRDGSKVHASNQGLPSGFAVHSRAVESKLEANNVVLKTLSS